MRIYNRLRRFAAFGSVHWLEPFDVRLHDRTTTDIVETDGSNGQRQRAHHR
jgi:hypothetical protein